MTKAKTQKMRRVDISDVNQLSFTIKAKTGEVVTVRAGKVNFILSQIEGCKIFFDNGLHIETNEMAAGVNSMLNECYKVVATGYFEVPADHDLAKLGAAAATKDNSASRRAAKAKRK